MTEIIPAIMPKTFDDVREHIVRIAPFVSTVQLDLMDGIFVPEKTWPFLEGDNEELENLRIISETALELDLMVKNASDNISIWAQIGIARIIFHIEAEDNLLENLESLDIYDRDSVQIGLAINTTTPIKKLEQYMPYIDFVQCMGIEQIGFQGEPFDERAIQQIERLRSEHPDVTISVDGGVDLETAPALLRAGANRLVSGSAIWSSADIGTVIENFKNI